MRNGRETTRLGPGRARVLARRQYARNCRPNNALYRRRTLGFETDREDPTSPSFGRERAPQSEGYVGQAAIPPFCPESQTTIT